jgi:hypothetical protein
MLFLVANRLTSAAINGTTQPTFAKEALMKIWSLINHVSEPNAKPKAEYSTKDRDPDFLK